MWALVSNIEIWGTGWGQGLGPWGGNFLFHLRYCRLVPLSAHSRQARQNMPLEALALPCWWSMITHTHTCKLLSMPRVQASPTSREQQSQLAALRPNAHLSPLQPPTYPGDTLCRPNAHAHTHKHNGITQNLTRQHFACHLVALLLSTAFCFLRLLCCSM